MSLLFFMEAHFCQILSPSYWRKWASIVCPLWQKVTLNWQSALTHVFCFALHRFREVMQANEPEVHEVSSLFRSVLLEALDHLKEEQEAQRLARQWNNKRAMSMSLMNFRSRIKINPFGSTVGLTSAAAEGAGLSDLKTVSEDVERGMEREDRAQRVWSMPDFRYKGADSSKVVWCRTFWGGTDARLWDSAAVHPLCTRRGRMNPIILLPPQYETTQHFDLFTYLSIWKGDARCFSQIFCTLTTLIFSTWNSFAWDYHLSQWCLLYFVEIWHLSTEGYLL